MQTLDWDTGLAFLLPQNISLLCFVISCLLILSHLDLWWRKVPHPALVSLMGCQTKANTQSYNLAESARGRKQEVSNKLWDSKKSNRSRVMRNGLQINEGHIHHCAPPLYISNPQLTFLDPRHSEIFNSDLLAYEFVRFFPISYVVM